MPPGVKFHISIQFGSSPGSAFIKLLYSPFCSQSWCLQSQRLRIYFYVLILCSCVSVFVCASVLRGWQRVTDSQAVVWERNSFYLTPMQEGRVCWGGCGSAVPWGNRLLKTVPCWRLGTVTQDLAVVTNEWGKVCALEDDVPCSLVWMAPRFGDSTGRHVS